MCVNCLRASLPEQRANALAEAIIGPRFTALRESYGHGGTVALRVDGSDGRTYLLANGTVIELDEDDNPTVYWCGNLGYYANYPFADHVLGQYLTITTNAAHWRMKAIPTRLYGEQGYYRQYVESAI